MCNVISMWKPCASCAVVWNGISDEITSVPTFFLKGWDGWIRLIENEGKERKKGRT